ncbi:hypothetical protein [Streptomyces cyaneofuscatus]|uniref:hypothetical protein n=1 Tax=Streptomyces cyaneofuscatus TaxID=66883 RepID=UPI003417B561
MEQMERDEQEFAPRMAQLLDTYAAELPAPGTDLVRGGLARGRRTRRRRRFLGGLAVCTVAMAGGLVFTGLKPDGDTSRQAADSAVTIPDFSLAAAESPPEGKDPVTGKAVVATLGKLLPGQPPTSGRTWWDGDEDGGTVSAGGRLLTGTGQDRAETAVSLQGRFQLTAFDALDKEAARAAGGAEQDKSGTTAPEKSEAAKEAGQDKKVRPATDAELQAFYSCEGRKDAELTMASCTARNLKDGSVLISYEEKSGSFTRRTADLLRADGTRILLVTSNSADSKRGPTGAGSPPVDRAALDRMVQSPHWQAWVAPAA